MNFFNCNYDEKTDTMCISFQDDLFSDIKEVEKNIFIKKNIFTNKITTIIVANFSKGFEQKPKQKKVDLANLFSKLNTQLYTMDDLLKKDQYLSFDDMFKNLNKNRINPEDEKQQGEW